MNDTKSKESTENKDSIRPEILVVDDEETIRFCLKEALERVGYKVNTAENGENALKLMKK
ncbi:MAG: response regulator, partial [Candidatus Scalindua sp.]|nr:response regulator [Candidatus Scalindua sp.]